MTETVNINMANDLGYGSVKTLINNHTYLIPSVNAVLRNQDKIQPIRFEKNTDLADYMETFMDHLDVSIQSQQVQERGQMFVGQAAINSRLSLDNFNVNNMQGKSQTDLAMILTLSIIAGEALKEEFQKIDDGQITSLPFRDLNVNVTMATALPIMEAQRLGAIDRYKERFLNDGHAHLVIVNNFDDPITVYINFTNVEIADEGETALYKIRHANSSLEKLIRQDFDLAYPKLKDQISDNKQLTQRPNAMVIDIGEGTTDFAVFTNNRINDHASSSMQRGYGNVLEEAMKELQQNGVDINKRADMQELLNKPEDPFMGDRVRNAKKAVNDQLNIFSKAITDEFSRNLRNAGSNIEIIYVLGGGATPMNELSDLRDRLVNETKMQVGGNGIIVIFINKLYAQLLNEAGLQLILDTMTASEEE